MQLVVPLDVRAVARRLDRSKDHSPTYDGPASADAATAPLGFRLDRRVATIGGGHEVLLRARAGLSRWASHRVPGLALYPSDLPVALGVTALVLFGLPILAVVAPCRIVDVTDDPDRFGFAYRTLPGHPECGEERFEVAMDNGGAVTFTVTAISRPAAPILRALPPLGHGVQHLVASAYVSAMRRHVRRARP